MGPSWDLSTAGIFLGYCFYRLKNFCYILLAVGYNRFCRHRGDARGVGEEMCIRDRSTMVKITGAGLQESHPHDVYITKEAPNYSTNR